MIAPIFNQGGWRWSISRRRSSRFPRRTRDFTEKEGMPFYVVSRKILMRRVPQDVEGLQNDEEREHTAVSPCVIVVQPAAQPGILHRHPHAIAAEQCGGRPSHRVGMTEAWLNRTPTDVSDGTTPVSRIADHIETLTIRDSLQKGTRDLL